MNIYLDFEGFTNKEYALLPPVLVGYKIRGKFVQYILDAEFKMLENEVKNLSFISFESFLDQIIEYSIKKKLTICAYSGHELDLIEKYSKYSKEEINYLDVRKKVKKFVNSNIKLKKLHKNMKEFENKDKYNKTRWKLSTMLRLFRFQNFDIKTYGGGVTTKRLRDVMSGLKRSKDFSGLTRTQKGKWTKLLNHNRIDVDGIEYLMDIIS